MNDLLLRAADTLETPSTSEWNEAIEAAVKVCDYYQEKVLSQEIRALKRKEQ